MRRPPIPGVARRLTCKDAAFPQEVARARSSTVTADARGVVGPLTSRPTRELTPTRLGFSLPSVVTPRYVALMNDRYDRIRAAAWGNADLVIVYDGEEWSAAIDRRPPPARVRRVEGRGLTLNLALGELEKKLGLDRWIGV